MIEGLIADYFLADKGYDSQALVAAAEAKGDDGVDPIGENSLERREYEEVIDEERNKIERLFNQLNRCRRIATRYEKSDRNVLAMLQLAGTML